MANLVMQSAAQHVWCFKAAAKARRGAAPSRAALIARQSRNAPQQRHSLRLVHSLAVRIVAATTENAEELAMEVEEDAMERMEKSLDATKRSFGTVRTGRANPAMLDRIEVDYYGASTPLRQIAGISTPEASLLVVQPYDKSAIPAIERAIMSSDIGLTPNNDGNVIRLQIPQLTAERRKEMTKIVSKLGEEGKVAVRNVRRDAMKAVEKLEKDGALSEDQRKGLEDSIQKLTDDYVKQIDVLVKGKQDELSKV